MFKSVFIIFLFLCLIKSGFGFCEYIKNCTCEEDAVNQWLVQCKTSEDNGNFRLIFDTEAEKLSIYCNTDDLISELMPFNLLRKHQNLLKNIRITNCRIPSDLTLKDITGDVVLDTTVSIELQLKELNFINKNFFDGIENLRTLSLINVEITNIWNIVEKNTNLRSLELRNNNLTTIPILNLPVLKEFVIHNNEIATIENDTFTNLPNLNSFLIRSTKLNSVSEDVFSKINSLSSIDLINKDKQMNSINKHFLKNLNHIRSVVINIGLTKIDNDFFEHQVSVIYIGLDQNELTEIPADLFEAATNLTSVNLSFNKLVTLDEKMFNKNSKLQNINLSNNQFVRLPNSIFNPCVNLERLYLDDNKLETFKFNAISHKALQFIDIGDNELVLDDECIFKNLQISSPITLYLQNNKIDDLSLLRCLIRSDSIQELNLSGNKIQRISNSDIDVNRFDRLHLNLFENNITEIEFWDSPDFQIAPEIKDYYEQNRNFISLRISGCPFFCKDLTFLQNEDNLKKLNSKMKYKNTEMEFMTNSINYLNYQLCLSPDLISDGSRP